MEEKFDHFCKAFAVGSSLAKLVQSNVAMNERLAAASQLSLW